MTIDPDTQMLLREEMKRTGESFKKVLNRSIWMGLGGESGNRTPVKVEPLFEVPFPLEFGDRRMNRLADEFDDEETLKELAR